MSRPGGLVVAAVGATGAVGERLLALLARSSLPVAELLPIASERSRGRVLRFRRRPVKVRTLRAAELARADLVFFVSHKDLSLQHAPGLAARGAWVIDDSSAFRLDPKVPLVVPEVNGSVLAAGPRLIAGPNCAATPIVMAAAAIGRRFGLRSVRAATYQSASGWGKAAVSELEHQARTWARTGRIPAARVLPRRLFLNLFPHIDRFDGSGYTLEELKIAAETRKILGLPGLAVTATAVRVPVLVGHCAAVWIETEDPASPQAARRELARFPGMEVVDDPAKALYPTPEDAAGGLPVLAGRVRRGSHPREILLWLASDNLLKGAALNSIQIAETLLEKGRLAPRAPRD